MWVRSDVRDERGHVFCADSGRHSLVCLKIVYVQEDTLLLQLCSCVPHWLRPLHPSGFSFSIKFNWSPSISGNIRTDHLPWRWQTQMFLAVQRPGEHTPVHPWPPGMEPGQLYIVWSSVTTILAQWNLLLNWLRESCFQCDSSMNYRRICFITLALCCLSRWDHTAPLSHFASSWGAVKWTVYTLLREGVIKSVKFNEFI